MKTLRWMPFLMLTAVLLPVTGHAKKTLDIQHWLTANGAKVYFVPVKTADLPIVDVNVVFAAGSARDEKKPGLARLTGALLLQGSEDYTVDQIAEQFEQGGVQVSTHVDRDKSTLHLRTLTDKKIMDPALSLFAHVIAHPAFNLTDFKREKNNTLLAIKERTQEPARVADVDFFKAVYDGYAYGHPVLGTKHSVSALQVTDSEIFYQRYYVAKNAIITLVGAINKQEARRIAEQIAGNFPQGKAAPQLAAIPVTAQDKPVKIKFPTPQTYIRMGQLGITYHDLDYFPLYVGNYILGGSGLVSRLFGEVREKRGLSYGVSSYFYPMEAQGPFYIRLQTRNDQTEQAIKVVHHTLKHFISKGPAVNELEDAKKNIINGYPLRFSSNKNISAYLVRLGFYDLPLDYYDSYPKRVKSVSLQQIQQAFQRRINLDGLVTVIVGA